MISLSKRLTCSCLFITAFMFVMQGCKKDKDDAPASGNYPKTVSIEYRVSSPAGFTQLMQLQYTNETGGIHSATNVSLPFSKSLSKSVNRFEILVLSFGATGAGQLKGDILVDGTVVATKTFTGSSGTSTVPGQVTYTFQ